MGIIVSAFALSLAVAACASPSSTVPTSSAPSTGWREPAGAKATSANERIVYVFQGNGRGSHPFGTLTSDGHGAFYGTTVDGGGVCGQFVCGTIVKLTPRHGRYAESVLYRFQNTGDGYFSNTGLIVDATGSIYGTSPCCYYGQQGEGVLFKLSPAKRHYRLTTLFAFSGLGPFPNGGLIVDNTGTFFGTAYQGGSSPADGAVFAL
ncbi:MAG: choice-of-anchor tandem repeat GloVer-containing protein, partial [Candidatus Cybelea sp.]